MKYKTILVTGGAGFVGSNLAISFKRKYSKARVIVLDSLKRRGSETNIPRLKEEGINFIHGDIRSPEDLIFNTRVDLLIECSAEPSVLAGFGNNPAYIINTNLLGTVNCLELARKDKADIIFLSSSRVYPYEKINSIKTLERPTRFEWKANQHITGWSKDGLDVNFTTQGAKTLYGATKLASELILTEYLKMYGLKGVINRCGAIAGPGQFGKVDQGVFTLWMLAHYFKKDLNYIGFGGKGKQVRDILHVDDLFELIDLELSALGRISGRVYNVGGGRKVSLSLLETTQICEKITGNKIKIGREFVNRPGDIPIYLTDNRKVQAELGWYPKRNPERLLGDIYEWIRINANWLKK